MSKTLIDNATVEQLRAFCDERGLEYDGRLAAAGLRALIRQAMPDLAEIDAPEPEAPRARPAKATADPSAEKTHFKVLIQEQDPQFVPGGDQPVWLGCNGDGLFVPRGQICDVPIKYRDSLVNAKQVVFRQAVDEQGMPAGIAEPREVYSYPHQIFD
jgi:hypothetical protein